MGERLARSNGAIVVIRYSALAATAILAFAFTQLNGLLRPTVEGPPWQFVILAGLALGAVITWTGLSYRLATWVVMLLNLLAAIIVAFRIATPETLTFLVPTADSFSALSEQLRQALSIIRSGIEPVIPVSGLVVIVMVVFWAVGTLTAYALVTGRNGLAVLPGIVLSLQFATMDRNPTGAGRIMVFVILLAGAVLAVTRDERASTAGRMAHASGVTPTRRLLSSATPLALVVTLLGSLIVVGAFRDRVPYDGVVAWRARTGLTGGYFGSVSYNPFASIQQSLVTNTRTPLFIAQVSGDLSAERVYFRLLTLDTYVAGQFFADRPEVEPLETENWEDPGHGFEGPTARIETNIFISQLQMDWLPAAYTPVAVRGDDSFTGSLRIRNDDGSLLLDGGLSYPELVYSVESEVPVPDLAVLATGDDGQLSPLFETAADDNAPVPEPETAPIREEPPNVERFLQLPEELDPDIATLARDKTANLDTSFEVGLALEAWFRSTDFRYTTDIEPGHGATDLADWLLDPESPSHRAGYCENFATSMAVMARTLGVPSRVVLGFTPGDRTADENVVIVRDRNAHAWVELWMPQQGWVRFDPTPRPDRINPTTAGEVAEELGFDPVAYFDQIPAPSIPGTEVPPNLFDPADIADEDLRINPDLFDVPVGSANGSLIPSWLGSAALAAGIALVLLGGIPFVKWWRRRRRLARLRRGDITAAWEDIVSRLEDYGERPRSSLTPAELAASVDPTMQPLALVYGRAVYGPPNAITDSHVSTATTSLQQVSERLAGRYSTPQRIAAWYRVSSLIPERWRRNA